MFDFDGVFTDNRVWVNEQGDETLAFSRSDGLGLRRLEEVGVRPLIVSMEQNPIVGARAGKLQVDCVQGVEDKLAVLHERTGELGVALEDTAYVGNDINDAECLRAVGVPVVPADAWPEVKPLARWVLLACRRHRLRERVLRRACGRRSGHDAISSRSRAGSPS